MKRGAIWTVSGGADYSGKPRPAVILQRNEYWDTESITLCPLTTRGQDKHEIRITVSPDEGNGLEEKSHIMVDKISTVLKSKVGPRIGCLGEKEMSRLTIAAGRFLGIVAESHGRVARSLLD